MICAQCRRDNSPGSRFCIECGHRLAASCLSCGTDLPEGARFCSQCGARVATQTPDAPSRFGAPDHYTPKHLADRIIKSKTALEGERKQVTVLFADLKGSMEMLADRDPEEARKILDPVLDLMMEAVHRYEGTVNQVMGDGIMALFGAPIGHEDHAVRACYAALRMQDTAARYADERRRAGGSPVQIRVGINSGEVVVRSIATDLHMDYTAVGLTTHLAARMEQLARPGAVLLAPETVRLAEGWVEVTPLGTIGIKGFDAPVKAFELVGTGPARSRLHASAARGLSRFGGREAELEHLRRALASAGAGHGQVVAVVGEPGVGKSRLYWEFTHSHRTTGWLVLESGSVSYGRATPYLPVIDLLKAYFKVHARDEPRDLREKLTGKILALDETLKPTLAPFLALLDQPVDDEEWLRADPVRRRQRTLDALKRLLLRESQVQPLLILFEDLHWIDTETQALLETLVDALPATRILLLVNYRLEYRHDWGGRTYYSQLRLDPLPEESANELLTALVGDDPSLAPLRALLIERTEGNPLFLEESVRALAETGALEGERGAYRLAGAVPSVRVPSSVQALIAARIDRLDPLDKHLLQSAAVIGKDVPLRLLEAIEEHGRPAGEPLARLQAAEFLYETRVYPDPEYTFKHALTHEVAYASMLAGPRRALHGRIVTAIERIGNGRAAEHVERLAHHARQAEEWPKALDYLHQAGEKALAHSAYRAATEYFEHALDALKRLPETPDALKTAIDLRFDLRRALGGVNETERMLEVLREAEALARRLGDRRRLAWAFAYLANISMIRGEPAQGLSPGDQAVALAEELNDPVLRVVASIGLAQVLHGIGDFPRAIETVRWTLDELSPDREGETLGMTGLPAVTSRQQLVITYTELGQFDEALDHARQATRIADRADHTYSRVLAAIAEAAVCARRGDVADALRAVERSQRLAEASGVLVPPARNVAGLVFSLAGRHDEALLTFEEALQFERARLPAPRPGTLVLLAEAHLLAGRLTEAVALVEDTLPRARAARLRGSEAWLLHLGAEATRQVDAPDRAAAPARYGAALALAEALGMRPLVARNRFGLARLLADPDDRPAARRQLEHAIAMFREMKMGSWLEQASTALNQLT